MKCSCEFIDGTVVSMCNDCMSHMHKTEIKSVCFTGHRPNKLGLSYSFKDPKVKGYSNLLKSHIVPLISSGHTRFISGGALGIDQIAFWTVHQLQKEGHKIENVVAVPFKKQHTAWKNKELVAWYHEMLKRADKVVYVDEHLELPRIGEYSAHKMQVRNEFMVNHSDVVIGVWDGTAGGTGNCMKYAEKQNKDIIRVMPVR